MLLGNTLPGLGLSAKHCYVRRLQCPLGLKESECFVLWEAGSHSIALPDLEITLQLRLLPHSRSSCLSFPVTAVMGVLQHTQAKPSTFYRVRCWEGSLLGKLFSGELRRDSVAMKLSNNQLGIKIRIQRIKETKSRLFEKISTIHKPLAKLTKRKKEGEYLNTQNE